MHGTSLIRLNSVLFAVLATAVLVGSGASNTARARSQAPAAHRAIVFVYLVSLGDNGRNGRKIGCGDSLVPVKLLIRGGARKTRAAIAWLLADHKAHRPASDLYSAMYQSTLQVSRVWTHAGTVYLYLKGQMNLNGECDNPRAATQLRATAKQYRSVTRTRIYINGVPLSKALSLR